MDPSFSARLPWSRQQNEWSRGVAERRRSAAALLDLAESNPTRVGLCYDGPAILGSLCDPGSLRHEPAARGLFEARHAVARYYLRRGYSVDPGEIVLTASTSEAYGWLFKLLAGPGDEILVPQPSYPLFEHLAALECVALRPYALRYGDGWWIDFDSLERQAGERCRAIVLVNPNNPTGSFTGREELLKLERFCAARGLAVISDEVFWDYPLAPRESSVPTLLDWPGPLRFCLGGFSKALGLPQMKLGWIVARGPADAARRAMDGLEWIADTYLSVSAPVQHAAASLLDNAGRFQQDLRGRLRENLDTCLRLAGAPGCAWQPLPVEGGWNVVLRLPAIRSDEQWALDFLDRDGVIVQPGYLYDFTSGAFVVASLLPDPALFHAGLERIAATVQHFSEGDFIHD